MEIKVLGVCGTPVRRKVAKGETNTEVLLRTVMDSAKEEGDVQTDILWLAEDGFNTGCEHCNWCLLKQSAESRVCSKNDAMTNEYYAKVLAADALVLATPVYIGRMSWLLAAFIDRLRALLEGKYYGFRGPLGGVLQDKVLAAAAVAWFRHGGVESALLTTLTCTSFIYGMIPVVASPIPNYGGFGYGAGGVSVGGPDELANVKNDDYAMRSAKNLGKRVVKVTRIIKAGKEALAKVKA